MKVLGYNGGLDGYPSTFDQCHDAAAAIVVDGKVIAACEEERFSREKHSGKFPRRAIEYCLREAGLRGVQDLDLVSYFYSYPLMFQREMFSTNSASLGPVEKAAQWLGINGVRAYNKLAGYNDARNRKVFEREMGVPLRDEQYYVVKHHMCHVASAYYESGFDRALCFTIDAQGESTANLVAIANGTDIREVREVFAYNSFGYLYAFVTSFLGFGRHDEYKIMGLAPYGDRARYREFFRSIVRKLPEGRYEVSPGMITHLMARDAFAPPGKFFPRAMVEALGPARLGDEPVLQRHMDIAASLQECLEETVLHALEYLAKSTGEKNLCMAGGVALNCTMNGKIARAGLFENIYIHPAAHDAGTSVGAALYGYHNVLQQPLRPLAKSEKRSVYLGPGYDDRSVERALEQFDQKITHQQPDDLYAYVAQQIADGKVVGWYQGRMEWGPRALGNRSILADARRDDMKDIVNHAVKLREGFRPFAPACLAEEVNDWFDMKGLKDSPYMLFIVPVQEDKRAKIPAVTHVDGSARVQTVTAQDNERFHKLLQAFHKITGVPVMMNTSFNVKNEPIVNTPADAIRCFLGTQIDLLVLHDVVVEKRPEIAAAQAAERPRRAQDSGRVIDGQINAV